MRGLFGLVVISWALIGAMAHFLKSGEIMVAAILFILLALSFMTASAYFKLMPNQERSSQRRGRPHRDRP